MIFNKPEFALCRKILCKSKIFWFSGSGKDFINDPTLFLHFCDYLSFEDLALQFYHIKFPLPKEDLYTKFK
jgi:hypothetical protein